MPTGLRAKSSLYSERAGKRHLDREGIEDLDVLDRSDLASPRRGQLGVAHAIEIPLHDVGVELGAVVEFHAAAQLEDVHEAAALDLPRLRELRHDAESGIDVDELAVDVVVDLPIHRRRRAMRVHRGRVGVHTDPDRAAPHLRHRRGRQRRHHDDRQGYEPHPAPHRTPPHRFTVPHEFTASPAAIIAQRCIFGRARQGGDHGAFRRHADDVRRP